MLRLLAVAGRYGRWWLVAGLIAGLTLPEVAIALVPWLPHMIAGLLFLNALRIGPKLALGSVSGVGQTATIALVYQLVAPLLVMAAFLFVGIAHLPWALAIVLVLSAPSVTGAPNFSVMLGHRPEAAMRLLLIGTAIFPLTVVPVLMVSPVAETSGEVVMAAARLLLVIAASVGLAFLIRHQLKRPLEQAETAALDGASAVLLAVVVVGLMAAAGPALRETPLVFLAWLAFALSLNLGLQCLAYVTLPIVKEDRPATAIVAGNRNIALFLVALPPETVAPLLLFIACYQVPMYLTPILMRPVFR